MGNHYQRTFKDPARSVPAHSAEHSVFKLKPKARSKHSSQLPQLLTCVGTVTPPVSSGHGTVAESCPCSSRNEWLYGRLGEWAPRTMHLHSPTGSAAIQRLRLWGLEDLWADGRTKCPQYSVSENAEHHRRRDQPQPLLQKHRGLFSPCGLQPCSWDVTGSK